MCKISRYIAINLIISIIKTLLLPWYLPLFNTFLNLTRLPSRNSQLYFLKFYIILFIYINIFDSTRSNFYFVCFTRTCYYDPRIRLGTPHIMSTNHVTSRKAARWATKRALDAFIVEYIELFDIWQGEQQAPRYFLYKNTMFFL